MNLAVTTSAPLPAQLASPILPSVIGLSKRSLPVEKIGDSACYQNILAEYPGMDSASKSIAEIFCENRVEALDAGFPSLSDQGIHGMMEALKQNTNLKSFKIIFECLQTPVDQDCTMTFANDLVTALKVNRGLKSLSLQTVFPYKELASQVLFSSLPCFNLRSLTFQGPIAPTAAATVFLTIFAQKFPLVNFSWNMCLEPMDETMGSIIAPLANGIGHSTCIKTLDLSTNAMNATMITNLFGGIAKSKIQQFRLPEFVNGSGDRVPYAFSSEQTAEILDAVRSNPCFLECVPTNDPLPLDLEAGIDNITKSRTPCLSDPECSASQICPVTPAPYIHSFGEGIFVGAVTGTVITGIIAMGIYAVRNYRSRSGEEQPLLSSNTIQTRVVHE